MAEELNAEGTAPAEAAPPVPPPEPQVTTEVRRRDGFGEDGATQSTAPDLPAGLSVAADKYRGADWASLANYYCPIPGCEYSTLSGSADVEAHVRHRHLDRYQEIDEAGKLKEA